MQNSNSLNYNFGYDQAGQLSPSEVFEILAPYLSVRPVLPVVKLNSCKWLNV